MLLFTDIGARELCACRKHNVYVYTVYMLVKFGRGAQVLLAKAICAQLQLRLAYA